MDIYILDEKLNTVANYDFYKSIIWSNRYYKTGDFEMIIPLVKDVKEKIRQDYYIYRDRDYKDRIAERPKIIEKVELIENAGENSLLVSGRDVTALLERRAIYPTEILNGNYETCILNLINNHAVSPQDPKRLIDIFDIENTGLITDTIDAQVTGDTLLKYIEEVSADYKIGFRTDFSKDRKKFIFKIFKGVNRFESDSIVISRKNNNLVKYDYINDKQNYKNMAIVAGSGEGTERKVVRLNDDLMGLDRRELFVDAKDLSTTTSEGEIIPESEYMEQLRQRGSEKLSENKIDISNSCEIDPDGMFKFNKDFFVGDEIMCSGYTDFRERIVETTESDTATGVKTELTFEEVEEDG
ncbi:MAG: siphovirus ReqiPepy6 Gp37-like family protein [Lachnospiraceae bacterium]|nr:siphovirus ReqiPepy6 Gp37-like family protein [Lachnospiraceae bacterium]